MAQKDDTATLEITPWAGTLDQLIRAARLCAAEVAEGTPFPPGYNPSDRSQRYDASRAAAHHDAERARGIEVGVVEEGGFTRTLTAIDDLRDIGAARLREIVQIEFSIGGVGYSPTSVSLKVSRGGGLTARICGRERIWTAGLLHELQDIVTVRSPLAPRLLRERWMGLTVGLTFSVVDVCLAALLGSKTHWDPGLIFVTSLSVAGLVAAAIGIAGLRLPTMELLADYQRPTYQRWRKAIVASGWALVLGVLASAIWALVP